VLVPQHLNISLNRLSSMSEVKYKEHIEEVRLYLLRLIEKKYSPFGGKANENEIINNLKTLNHEIGVKFIPPKEFSNYLFTQKDEYADGLLTYNTTHTRGINHWFFEMWESECSSGVNPLEQIKSKDIFYRNLNAIIRKNKFKIAERFPDAILKDGLDVLRITNGSKPAFNFSSALAKWIYLDVANRSSIIGNDFYILDSCTGWGGRLGGALASCNHLPLQNKNVHYYGTDVNSSTHYNFYKVASYWKEYINPNIKFDLYKSLIPAEVLTEDPVFAELIGKFDVAMTSPPYFNTEQYSKDLNQSYIKYPFYDKGGENSWKIGFLKRMIQTTYDLLKNGGEFWLNIADVRSKNITIPLEHDAVKLAKQVGFKHLLTYKMITPNIYNIIEDQAKNRIDGKKIDKANIIMHEGKELKFEPIFIFKK
jgi:hypothetical protein